LSPTSFPYYSDSPEIYKATVANYYFFKLEGCDEILGYMPARIARQMPINQHWKLDTERRILTFQPRGTEGAPVVDLESRNWIMADYLYEVREKKIFKILDGWRNERFPIYGPQKELLLNMERAATALFGVVTYGVHMTGYVETEEGIKIWTPRRALNKDTYPGMMDNTVAGGLSTGEKPFECLVRECEEEASLPASLVHTAKACGTLTYFHIRDARAGGEIDLCEPECEYIYDLKMPLEVIPKPGDNEAIDFQLLSIEEVQSAMAAGRFKPNCAQVLLDFFVRHGILNAENEPCYNQIIWKLHRRLEFPTK